MLIARGAKSAVKVHTANWDSQLILSAVRRKLVQDERD
jgi:hypothetical protein